MDAQSAEGPFDVLGDVHGMIQTLDAMLEELGYRWTGTRWHHGEGRQLVALGDLLDRGPDPLACVERIAALAADGCAQMVLGNHELNALHYVEGLRENSEKNRAQFETTLVQIEADPARWDRARAFIESCPTHLLLDAGRLRVVHAYWDDAALARMPRCLDSRAKLEASAPGGSSRMSLNCASRGRRSAALATRTTAATGARPDGCPGGPRTRSMHPGSCLATTGSPGPSTPPSSRRGRAPAETRPVWTSGPAAAVL